MTFFQRCIYSLLLLLLFASGASAQSDSLQLHFGLNGDGISWGFETMISTSHGPVDGSYHNGAVVFALDTKMTLPNSNSVCINCGTPNSLSFTIDKSAQLIKNMVVKYEMQQRQALGTEVTTYEVHFGDLAFTQQDSLLTLSANQHTGTFTKLHVLYSGPSSNGMESGSWDSGGSHNFTLTTDIIAKSASATVVSNKSHQSFQIAQNNDRHTLQVSCDAMASERELSITNILGRQVCLQKLNPNSNAIEIAALPPGCYFARLVNEIAKFVVTE